MSTELADVLHRYVTWLRSWDASPATIRSREIIARSRLAAWGLEGFTPENIATYLARPELKTKWSRSTYHGHLTCFCAWLFAAELIDADPMPNVRKPKRPRSTPRPLTDSEVELVLAETAGRVRDWLLLGLHAGLRASEIAKLRGQDFTSDGIRVQGKGDVTVTLPCHPDLWAMAQRYPRTGYWFPGPEDGHMRGVTISMTVGRKFRPLGIEGSVHRMRHTYGTRLLRSGVNIRIVQKLMRHASLATTATYTAVDEDELRAAIYGLTSVA